MTYMKEPNALESHILELSQRQGVWFESNKGPGSKAQNELDLQGLHHKPALSFADLFFADGPAFLC